jgi:predicted metal-dependent phosphoesterase TrpH
MKLSYDLHLHSCLSPCAAPDMTPANLAAMCALAGIRVAALTDHNTTGNCAAFCRAAGRRGIVALPGMELTTAEEIHVICLLPDLGAAEDFGKRIYSLLPDIPNDKRIFGGSSI